MTSLSRISDSLKHLFDRFRKSGKKPIQKPEGIQETREMGPAKDSLNTLKNKKKELTEERQNIHQKIRDLDKKYKEGKISLTERDDNILKLLKKGVKLRKQIEKISKEIEKLETHP